MIELNPKSLELRMRKAECNIMLEQWQYALDEYSSILDLYPTHLGALYFRGFVNEKLHRYGFARNDYRQVLRYEPDHEGALKGLILVDIADKKWQDAFDGANHLIELYPDNTANYALRSQVEEGRGMLDLAIDDINVAIEREDKILSANYRLSYNDNFTQYVLQRIHLYKKLKGKKNRKLVEKDIQMLIDRGIPSNYFPK